MMPKRLAGWVAGAVVGLVEGGSANSVVAVEMTQIAIMTGSLRMCVSC